MKTLIRISLFLFIVCVVGYGVYLMRHNAHQTAQEAPRTIYSDTVETYIKYEYTLQLDSVGAPVDTVAIYYVQNKDTIHTGTVIGKSEFTFVNLPKQYIIACKDTVRTNKATLYLFWTPANQTFPAGGAGAPNNIYQNPLKYE